jgi:hypothetical protein
MVEARDHATYGTPQRIFVAYPSDMARPATARYRRSWPRRRSSLRSRAEEIVAGAPKPSPLSNPEHWRARAEAARAEVELLDNVDARRTMAGVAASYDSMADDAELLLAITKPNVGRL